ncbi:MAG: DUF4136 domain-containing protein [Marinobacter sp.]|nr:DUF4136 domain-containing protein [Marinobacter sp.]
MRIFLASMLLLALTGCASNVVTDYNASATFSQYRTWAFATDDEKQKAVSLDGARIRDALEKELTAKSLTRAEPETADLLVHYRIEDVERLDTSGLSFGLGLGRGPFGFGLGTAPPVQQVQEGKLVVELVDTRTNQVVWRAISKRHLNDDQSPETRSKLIHEVVTEMFTKYPPQG